jgi:hypothetical protein
MEVKVVSGVLTVVPDKEAQAAEAEKAGPILPQGLLFINLAAKETPATVAGHRVLD